MQILCSLVLAGEANTPGTYSKRTVNLLSELDKSDVELFTRLCRFCWMIEDFLVPLVFDENAEIYNVHGINFDTLSHLRDIGLVQLEFLSNFKWSGLSKRIVAAYYDKSLYLEMPEDVNNELYIGKTRLTKIGQELAPICESKPVDGFYGYVKKQWRAYLPPVNNIEQKK